MYHSRWSVGFIEAAEHPSTFTKFNIPSKMFLWFMIRRMVPNCQTHHICAFITYLGNFIIRFCGNEFFEFSKIVLVTVL